MPVLPPPGSTIFDTANTILNSARVRLNDKLETLFPVSGRILQNNEAFTQQVFNNAYRKFQEFLANLGYTPLKQEVIIPGIPIVANTDPASQEYIDWFSFFDGANYWTAPVLPNNFIQPLKVWERWTNQNQTFPDQPMEQYLDGLPTPPKTTYNGCWEWRDNKIYMPGSLMSMDLRILYIQYYADLVDVETSRWFTQSVPIVRCLEPMSLYICYEFCMARTPANDEEASMQAGAMKDFEAKAEAAAKLIFNRDVKTKQRGNFSRIPRSGRGGNGGGFWGGGYGTD